MLGRLLLVNGLVVVLAVAIAGLVAPGLVQPWRSIALTAIAIAAVVACLAGTGSTLRNALAPLHQLERDAQRVSAGEDIASGPSVSESGSPFGRMVVTTRAAMGWAGERGRMLRASAARTHATTEEEKRGLAVELHDGIAQSLAALNIRVKLARGAASSQVRDSVLDEVSSGISAAILDLRRMARDLRPPALEILGLAASVETCVRSVAGAAGLAVEIRAEKVSGLLSPEIELALYRILQESLSNVVRHASAQRVSVELGQSENRVHLVVEDDGRGFDPTIANGGNGRLGVFGMRERCEALGGNFQVSSMPGHGSRIAVTFPVNGRSEWQTT